ncbi:hypothetical protein QE152_g27048 [Popillia japonica]|uniref:Uncharacterized protein n=1 Tax=Popillia japonica TaxID=7064 RepID=A0AAW1JXC5_POPJA
MAKLALGIAKLEYKKECSHQTNNPQRHDGPDDRDEILDKSVADKKVVTIGVELQNNEDTRRTMANDGLVGKECEIVSNCSSSFFL